jgi:hypothetical protein
MWGEMLGTVKMKPKGRHPEKKLTALKVNRMAAPGRYADAQACKGGREPYS